MVRTLVCHSDAAGFRIFFNHSAKLDLDEEATSQVFVTFRTLVTSRLRGHPDATDCLLQPNLHEKILEAALAERQAIAQKNSQKKQGPQSWINKHIAYAKILEVRWATPVAQELTMNNLYATLTKREGDALVLSRVIGPSCEFRQWKSLCWQDHLQHAKQ